jgi:hypothetical protein
VVNRVRSRRGMVEVRFNPPKAQNGPVSWALFCVFGLGVSAWVMIRYPFGSESWQVGLLLAGTVLFGLVSIEGWWVVSQREIVIEDSSIRVRRWSDWILGRGGIVLPLEAIRVVGLVFDSGKKISLETHDGRRIRVWAALWPRREVERLIAECDARRILTAADW